MNRIAKFVAAAAVAASVTTPALAWGDREQGALAGIVGTLILQNVMRPQVVTVPNSGPVYAPQPHVHVPQVIVPNPHVYVVPSPIRTYTRRVDVFIPECNCYRTVEVQIVQ